MANGVKVRIVIVTYLGVNAAAPTTAGKYSRGKREKVNDLIFGNLVKSDFQLQFYLFPSLLIFPHSFTKQQI